MTFIPFQPNQRSNLTPNPFPNENKPEKKALVEALFKLVLNPAHKSKIAPLAMQVLRLTTRDTELVNSPAYKLEHLETLLHLANLVGEKETNLNESDHELFDSRIVVEAQKCLCNLLCLSPEVRRACAENSCLPGIMCRLRMHPDPNLPNEVKLFDMRMLFFLTCHLPNVRTRVRTEFHGLIYLMETIDLMLKNNAEAQSTNNGNNEDGAQRQPNRRRSKGSRRGRKNPDEEPAGVGNEGRVGDDDSLVAYCLDDTEVEIITQVLKVLFNLTIHISQVSKLDEVRFDQMLLFKCLLITFYSSKRLTTSDWFLFFTIFYFVIRRSLSGNTNSNRVPWNCCATCPAKATRSCCRRFPSSGGPKILSTSTMR